MPRSRAPYDVVVMGLGLAGLVAGLAAAGRGARVLVVGKGFGTLRFRSGTIDVLGYRDGRSVEAPEQELASLAGDQPDHPYALAGPDDLASGIRAVVDAADVLGLELKGSLDRNQMIATAVGTLRPTCLAPRSMLGVWAGARVLVVGLAGYRDFSSHLAASVLPRAAAGRGVELTARPLTVDVAGLHRRHLGGMELARAFEQASFRSELAAAVRPSLGDATLVAVPATLGLDGPVEARDDLVQKLGVPLVELPTLPPSVPGLRLERALSAALRRAGAVILVGPAGRLVPDGRLVGAVELQSPGRPFRIPAGQVILATGGLAGGGLEVLPDGHVRETAGGLPVRKPGAPRRLFASSFLEPQGHGAGWVGVGVDRDLRPVDAAGEPVYENLRAAGGVLAGANRAVEKSAGGICCATGWRAGMAAAA